MIDQHGRLWSVVVNQLRPVAWDTSLFWFEVKAEYDSRAGQFEYSDLKYVAKFASPKAATAHCLKLINLIPV